MFDDKEYLSKEGLEKMKLELEDLATNKRKEVAERLEYAKSLGDLSENAEYQEAKEAQSMLENKIARLEDVIRRAVVITKHHGGVVQVGSTVIIKKESSNDKKEYEIVGHEEADVSEGKISNESPLGMALIGAKKGETVSFSGPNGEIKYKVLDIK